MSNFRSSIQHDRLLQNIAKGGTDHRRMQRKLVLDEATKTGSITLRRAGELLGYRTYTSAFTLVSELVEEGQLTRIGRGTYAPDTILERN